MGEGKSGNIQKIASIYLGGHAHGAELVITRYHSQSKNQRRREAFALNKRNWQQDITRIQDGRAAPEFLVDTIFPDNPRGRPVIVTRELTQC